MYTTERTTERTRAVERTERTRATERTEAIRLIDPATAARLLGIDHQALLTLVNRGRLAAYDIGGSIRFRRSDVYALALRLGTAAA